MVIIMLNIINKHRLRVNILIVLTTLVVGLLSSCSMIDTRTPTYNSPEAAIAAYLDVDRGVNLKETNIKEMILKIIPNDSIDYYVMLSNRIIKEKDIYSVYILEIEKNAGMYTCSKLTADFSLKSIDDVNDEDFTPYTEYIIPVDDFYIHVGQIYVDEYIPYFNGRPLKLNKDKIYVYYVEDKNTETIFIQGSE